MNKDEARTAIFISMKNGIKSVPLGMSSDENISNTITTDKLTATDDII